MLETVASVELPIDEKFEIKKNHIRPRQNLSGKRICIGGFGGYENRQYH